MRHVFIDPLTRQRQQRQQRLNHQQLTLHLHIVCLRIFVCKYRAGVYGTDCAGVCPIRAQTEGGTEEPPGHIGHHQRRSSGSVCLGTSSETSSASARGEEGCQEGRQEGREEEKEEVDQRTIQYSPDNNNNNNNKCDVCVCVDKRVSPTAGSFVS